MVHSFIVIPIYISGFSVEFQTIEVCENITDDPAMNAMVSKTIETYVPEDMREDMSIMMKSMETFMETGEIDDLKPMLDKMQSVEENIDEALENMGMESFDDMSNSVQNDVANQVEQLQDDMNSVMLE